MTDITLNKGGTAEKTVAIESLQIPDLWHIAQYLSAKDRNAESNAVLECWYLAHALKEHIIG